MIKEQLAILNGPAVEEIMEGTVEAVREKLRRHAECLFCFMVFRGKVEYLDHLRGHREVAEWLQFREKAEQDYSEMQDIRSELSKQVAAGQKRLDEQVALVEQLRQKEAGKVSQLAAEGEIDERFGWISTKSPFSSGEVDVVKPDAELKRLRDKLQTVEGKAEAMKVELGRKRVRLSEIERKIWRFQKSADTAPIARGQGGELQELFAELDSIIGVEGGRLKSRGVIPRLNVTAPFEAQRQDLRQRRERGQEHADSLRQVASRLHQEQ
jgi:predicted  nucleic acid-binding Zn-ribbon protein